MSSIVPSATFESDASNVIDDLSSVDVFGVELVSDVASIEETAVVEIAEKEPLPQFEVWTYPSQIFWLLVSFSILYMLISRSALPRIHEVVDKRRHRMERDMDRADRLAEEARQSKAAYEQVEMDAREKAQSIIAVAQAEVTAMSEREHGQADDDVVAMLHKADDDIRARQEEFAHTLEQLSRDVAVNLVHELTGKTPDDIMLSTHIHQAI